MTIEIATSPEPPPVQDRLACSRAIIQALKTDPRLAPFRGRIRVFGSLITGKVNPGDIDILVDLAGIVPAPKGTRVGMMALLDLTQKYVLLDPVVYVYSRDYGHKDVLWRCAYNKHSLAWVHGVKNASLLLNAGRAGLPLAEVSL